MNDRFFPMEISWPSGKVIAYPSIKDAWQDNPCSVNDKTFHKKMRRYRLSLADRNQKTIKITHPDLVALMAHDSRPQAEEKVIDTIYTHLDSFDATLVSANGVKVSTPEQVYAQYTNNQMKIVFKCANPAHPVYEKELRRVESQGCPVCIRRQVRGNSRQKIIDTVNAHIQKHDVTLLSANGVPVTTPEQVFEQYTTDYTKVGFQCQEPNHPPYERAFRTLDRLLCPICAKIQKDQARFNNP